MKSPKLSIKKRIVLNASKNSSTKQNPNTTTTYPTGGGITVLTNYL